MIFNTTRLNDNCILLNLRITHTLKACTHEKKGGLKLVFEFDYPNFVVNCVIM